MTSIDSEVVSYQGSQGVIISFFDENDYIKCQRALKSYLLRSYKDLVFRVLPEIKSGELSDGDYETEIYTDEKFKMVYGTIKLRYLVKGNVVVIKELIPSTILHHIYGVIPHVYKGVPYTTATELFKIKLVLDNGVDLNG